MDFQHRVGSKTGLFPLFILHLPTRLLTRFSIGSGFVSESQSSLDRRERLRKLALEQIDISKDPYFMKNHLGTFECKLCLTLHANEGTIDYYSPTHSHAHSLTHSNVGSYLAHTQGKRHQSNLGMRAAMEAKNAAGGTMIIKKDDDKSKKKTIKIGRPAYKVTKSRDLTTNQRCLQFEIDYPMIEKDIQPRYRFMSAFEQKIEGTHSLIHSLTHSLTHLLTYILA